MSNAIPLPAETAARAAKTAVDAAKAWMIGMLWFDAIALLGFVAAVQSRAVHNSAGETIFGVGFWVVVFAAITLRFRRALRRARNAETLARTSPTTTWLLDGRKVIPIDEQNIPRLDLTFKISAMVRSTLFAVPQARIVERERPL